MSESTPATNKTIEQLFAERFPDAAERERQGWLLAAVRQKKGWAVGKELEAYELEHAIDEVLNIRISSERHVLTPPVGEH